MSHLVSTIPVRHAVFLPEAFVDDAGESAGAAQTKQPKGTLKSSQKVDEKKIGDWSMKPIAKESPSKQQETEQYKGQKVGGGA